MIACPAAALKAWLEAAAITGGAVFRPIAKGGRIQATRLTDRSVAEIVKGHAQRAGLDPTLFAGHSLRSGFLTSAAARRDGSIVTVFFKAILASASAAHSCRTWLQNPLDSRSETCPDIWNASRDSAVALQRC
jgi:hypothetical protein